LGTATDVLGKTSKTAGKRLKKVTENVKDVQDSLQDRIEAYQRKRARAKFLFRMGLLAGVVLALLYTPWPGSQTRQLLGAYWQQLSQRVQSWFNDF
jgi:gas vesicle protein